MGFSDRGRRAWCNGIQITRTAEGQSKERALMGAGVPILPQWGLVLEGFFGIWDPEQLYQVAGTLDHGRGIVMR